MQRTTRCDFDDVVLLPFPFTDGERSKQRPAVIVSGARFNASRPDVVLMPVTSRPYVAGDMGAALVAEWQQAGLLKPSVIKPILFTLKKRLFRRRLGVLTASDQNALRAALAFILG